MRNYCLATHLVAASDDVIELVCDHPPTHRGDHYDDSVGVFWATVEERQGAVVDDCNCYGDHEPASGTCPVKRQRIAPRNEREIREDR